jgi:Fe-S cluster assembly iron-binding protein IscA
MQINQQIGCVLALSASTGMAVRHALTLAGVSAESGGMRITARPTRNGYDYQFSIEPSARETDLVVEQHGVRVYVDPFTAQHLDGSAIDYSDGDGEEAGAAFTVTLPKRFGSQPRLVA